LIHNNTTITSHTIDVSVAGLRNVILSRDQVDSDALQPLSSRFVVEQ
jgi:hypothetical protein